MDAASIIGEYNRRRMMREIGFVDSINDLDSLTADYFIAIAIEISAIEKELTKKPRGK